jgi:hypothetical protein
MGSSTSHLLSDEAANLVAFSSEVPWPYDSERWLSCFWFKQSLYTITPADLTRELNDTATRLGACLPPCT